MAAMAASADRVPPALLLLRQLILIGCLLRARRCALHVLFNLLETPRTKQLFPSSCHPALDNGPRKETSGLGFGPTVPSSQDKHLAAPQSCPDLPSDQLPDETGDGCQCCTRPRGPVLRSPFSLGKEGIRLSPLAESHLPPGHLDPQEDSSRRLRCSAWVICII